MEEEDIEKYADKKEVKRFFKGCYNKVAYKSRKKAEEFMDYQWQKFGRKTYLYDCEYCQNYHLTTKKN